MSVSNEQPLAVNQLFVTHFSGSFFISSNQRRILNACYLTSWTERFWIHFSSLHCEMFNAESLIHCYTISTNFSNWFFNHFVIIFFLININSSLNSSRLCFAVSLIKFEIRDTFYYLWVYRALTKQNKLTIYFKV